MIGKVFVLKLEVYRFHISRCLWWELQFANQVVPQRIKQPLLKAGLLTVHTQVATKYPITTCLVIVLDTRWSKTSFTLVSSIDALHEPVPLELVVVQIVAVVGNFVLIVEVVKLEVYRVHLKASKGF